jgi:PTS system nitrogen regulatory IIA component
MAIVDLITQSVVKIPLEAENKPSVLCELVQVLKDAGRIEDVDGVLEAIHRREDMGSTGLEFGIAVPHAKTDRVDRLTMAIGISKNGIDFDALDGEPSMLFFFMLAPPDQTGPHIEALAEIAKIAKERKFCSRLMRASSAEEVVRLLREGAEFTTA